MAEFERIFSKFSTAEELTGAAGEDDDEDDDAAADREGGDGALVKVRRASTRTTLSRLRACWFCGRSAAAMQFSTGLRCQYTIVHVTLTRLSPRRSCERAFVWLRALPTISKAAARDSVLGRRRRRARGTPRMRTTARARRARARAGPSGKSGWRRACTSGR